MKQKLGICQDCTDGKEVPIVANRCQTHYWQFRAKISAEKNGKPKKVVKQIPRRSKKRAKEELQYLADRIVFLGKAENSICPITGQRATTVHHKKGKIGRLLLDQRYWIGLSMEGHEKVENSPQWAKEMGYSESRLLKINQV